MAVFFSVLFFVLILLFFLLFCIFIYIIRLFISPTTQAQAWMRNTDFTVSPHGWMDKFTWSTFWIIKKRYYSTLASRQRTRTFALFFFTKTRICFSMKDKKLWRPPLFLPSTVFLPSFFPVPTLKYYFCQNILFNFLFLVL